MSIFIHSERGTEERKYEDLLLDVLHSFEIGSHHVGSSHVIDRKDLLGILRCKAKHIYLKGINAKPVPEKAVDKRQAFMDFPETIDDFGFEDIVQIPSLDGPALVFTGRTNNFYEVFAGAVMLYLSQETQLSSGYIYSVLFRERMKEMSISLDMYPILKVISIEKNLLLLVGDKGHQYLAMVFAELHDLQRAVEPVRKIETFCDHIFSCPKKIVERKHWGYFLFEDKMDLESYLKGKNFAEKKRIAFQIGILGMNVQENGIGMEDVSMKSFVVQNDIVQLVPSSHWEVPPLSQFEAIMKKILGVKKDSFSEMMKELDEKKVLPSEKVMTFYRDIRNGIGHEKAKLLIPLPGSTLEKEAVNGAVVIFKGKYFIRGKYGTYHLVGENRSTMVFWDHLEEMIREIKVLEEKGWLN